VIKQKIHYINPEDPGQPKIENRAIGPQQESFPTQPGKSILPQLLKFPQ
jgi:hypothetical protein